MSTTILPTTKSSTEALLSDQFYRGPDSTQSLGLAPISPTTLEVKWQLRIRFGEALLIVEPAPDDWIVPTLQKVCELGALPPNWDSYGGQPICPEIGALAVELLLNLLSPNDPTPSIVPTSRGGILLEWHEGGIDLEVDIRSRSWLHLAFEEGQHEEEHDPADIEVVQEKLDLLRSRLK